MNFDIVEFISIIVIGIGLPVYVVLACLSMYFATMLLLNFGMALTGIRRLYLFSHPFLNLLTHVLVCVVTGAVIPFYLLQGGHVAIAFTTVAIGFVWALIGTFTLLFRAALEGWE